MTRVLSTTATCLTLTLVMFGFQNCGQKVGFSSDSVSQSLGKNAASGAVQPVAEISEPNASNGSSDRAPAQVSTNNHDEDDHDVDHEDDGDDDTDHAEKSADSSDCDQKKKSSTAGNEFVRCRLAKKYQFKLGIDPGTKGLAFVTSAADHICVREEICEGLIAKSFKQYTEEDENEGFCNNPKAVRLSDEQVKAYLAK